MPYKTDGVSLGRAEVTGGTPSGLWLYVESLGEIAKRNVFVPFSQIHDDSEVYQLSSEPGELVVTEWLAHERGWI